MSAKKHVLVPAADGSEDIELSCLTDILARGGIDYTVASVMPEGRTNIVLARNLKLACDTHIDAVASLDKFDAVLLPGGLPGADHLGASAPLKKLIADAVASNKLYGAICASPVVALPPLGAYAATGANAVAAITCYPGLKDKVPAGLRYEATAPVVLSGRCLTSRGPGTAMYFGLAAVALLNSAAAAKQIAQDLLIDHQPEVAQTLAAVGA